jgi:hypothetical protein
MAHYASASYLGSEFDDFLFAPIGEDQNGMLLSVVSALARLDIDPWQEAAKLTRLPSEIATKQLASLISVLPDGVSANLDTGTIAARLVSLLPRQVPSNVSPRATALGIGVVITRHALIFGILLIIVALGEHFIAAGH